jgi:hypothetical protein
MGCGLSSKQGRKGCNIERLLMPGFAKSPKTGLPWLRIPAPQHIKRFSHSGDKDAIARYLNPSFHLTGRHVISRVPESHCPESRQVWTNHRVALDPQSSQMFLLDTLHLGPNNGIHDQNPISAYRGQIATCGLGRVPLICTNPAK